MVANYFLGAAVLMLTTVIAFSTDLCLCPENTYRYSSDCCSVHSFTTMKPIWNIWTRQKPLWDISWTTRPVWYARTAKPLWKQLMTRSAFLDYLLSRRHQIWYISTTPKTTRKTINWRDIQQMLDNIRKPTRTPYLDSYNFGGWSTTQGSDTGIGVKAVGISVGLIMGCGFLPLCVIAARAIVKRRRQRAILKRQRQLQTQPTSCLRILVRRSPEIASGTDVCLCPANIYRFYPNCCSLPTKFRRWKKWTTHKPILDTSWTTRIVWSTTQGSYTGSCSADVRVSIGLIISCGFVSFCCIAAWIIVTRRRQRSLDRRSPVPNNMENINSNTETNLNVPRTGTYAYGEDGQGSITEGLPPPYTPASQCEPVTPFAPPPYTLGSYSEPVVLIAPPPYTPASLSVPPPPYSEYI